MTNQNHLFTPPPKLLQQWANEAIAPDGFPTEAKWQRKFATLAAQWGADQELDACCEWLPSDLTIDGECLRDVRRPKPPSLAEEALAAQQRMCCGMSNHGDWDVIYRALERLKELEDQQ